MGRLRSAFELVKRSAIAWSDDYASSMGAAISFYTLFSITPLLIILIAILGALFGQDGAEARILAELESEVGKSSAQAIAGVLRNARGQASSGWAAVLGGVTLLVGSTSVLVELQSALDRIWRTSQAPPPGGIGAFVRARILTFGLILGLVFLLLVSFVVSAVLAAIGRWASGSILDWKWIVDLVNSLVSFGVVTLLFAMIYKLLPREQLAWRDVWVGAIATASLFTLGKYVIGKYLSWSGTASTYGAAASLIVLLLWVYYSAQIFLFGAEFTHVYAYARGSRATPPLERSEGRLPPRLRT